MIGGGGTDGGDLRRLRRRPHDLDEVAVEPVRHRTRSRDPAHRHVAGDGVEQRPPDGRELRDADDLDGAEQRRCMVQPHPPRSHEVGGPHHRRRQRLRDRRFQNGHRVEAGMLAGPCLEVDARTPRFAQRVGGGLTIPGSALMPSSSPSTVSGRTALTASRRASSSTGRASPPASRAASCSNVMTCRPCRRSRPASSRSSRIPSRPWATVVRRSKSSTST